MRWKKLGLLTSPLLFNQGWRSSHAMIPTPQHAASDNIRVYCSFCDRQGIGRPGYVDLDAENPLRIQAISETPLLDIGEAGCFDENGVLLTSVVCLDEKNIFLYYVGFELGVKIRYRLFTGLAISEDGGGKFRRVQKTPILERSPDELFFRCGPQVIYENGVFRMWYVAGSRWEEVGGKSLPMYEIKYAESNDGIRWPSSGRMVLPITLADEHGFGRPWVNFDKTHGEYAMLYSVRRRSLGAYRLGYAVSSDGINWIRKDEEIGLDASLAGIDDQAMMYAATIWVKNKEYCFYNGNNFGEKGFCIAERQ